MNRIDQLSLKCQQVQRKCQQAFFDKHKDDDIIGLLELAVAHGYPGVVWFEFPQDMMSAMKVFQWADQRIKDMNLIGTRPMAQCTATWYPVHFSPRGQCLRTPATKMVPVGITLPQAHIDDLGLFQDHGGPLNPNNECCGRCHMVYFLTLEERKKIIDEIEAKVHQVLLKDVANLVVSHLGWRTGLSA